MEKLSSYVDIEQLWIYIPEEWTHYFNLQTFGIVKQIRDELDFNMPNPHASEEEEIECLELLQIMEMYGYVALDGHLVKRIPIKDESEPVPQGS